MSGQPAIPGIGERAVLVVSPHFDDGVLSAHSLITLPTATVMTVFSAGPEVAMATEWDRACGFADSSTAMAERRREDDLAFAGLSAKRLFIGLAEGQYRNGEALDTDTPALLTAVNEWVKDHPAGIVALPVGAGGHLTLVHRVRHKIPHPRIGLPGGTSPSPEHVWVTDVLCRDLPSVVPIVVYEELPYGWVKRGNERAAQLGRSRSPFQQVDVPIDRADKGRRVELYASQRRVIFAPWVQMPKHLPSTERIWIPTGF